jgi:signal transduction histidine kinase
MLTAAGEDERSKARPQREVEGQSRKSIARRVVFVVLASTAAALLVACAALLYYDSRVYHRAVIDDVTTQAQIIGQASAAALLFDDAKSARENLALLQSKPEIVAGALYNARGALFATYGARSAPEQFPKLSESDGTRIEGRHLILFRRIIENNEVLGTVYLKAEYRLAEHVLNYLAIIGVVLAIGLLVAFGIAAWLQRTISTPVLAMRDIAREVVEKRDFSLRATNTSNDEIGYLADAFNDMLSEIQRRADALERSNATLARAEEDLKMLNAELEQRIADRTRQLEAANKELESFSYSVSHDLRAPVRAIAGFSKMLADGHGEHLDDEGKRKLGIVRSEAARMGALIDDLLAFSRLGRQSIQRGPVDMKELVLRNFETLKAQHQGAEPDLRLGYLPPASGDRSLLAQVWVNLISNALKFSSKKDKPVIEVSAVSDAAEHTYFVRDNGAGFDPRFAAKLFGVFQRLHDASEFSGTGVGLALVQRIVTRHGGRVWAEGEPGVGATFYFTLPRESSDGAVRADRDSAG